MTDKEIALELTKIVVSYTKLKIYTDTNKYDDTYEDIPRVDVAKEISDIYNTIYNQIHVSE
ncbi:hypothetical protein KDE13_07580 [Campylobacter sp. faydin G-140]|uniref:hypothetical protein n=1 Tax=Campylobacter anatolicus TaxID=2829105 RepID=UPI001B905A49|nr:hypothetical protein [Campylobacter anatolicus]MBR8466198.1 hypothetical protein [Campylobacter anatolicus]